MSAEAPAQRLSDPTQAPPQYIDGSDIRPYEMKRVVMIKRAMVAGLFALVLLTAVVVTAVVTKAASASGGPQAASVSENGAMPSFLAMRGQSTQEPNIYTECWEVCEIPGTNNVGAQTPDGCCDWDNVAYVDGKTVCAPTLMMGSVRGDDSSCFANEVCYVGDDAANDCCSGAVITDLSCSMALQCEICEKGVGALLPEIQAAANEPCDTLLPAATSACEALVEAPFEGVCSVVLSLACPKIEDLISDATSDATDFLNSLTASSICSTIGYCESSLRGEVRAMNLDTGIASIFGQACGCVASGDCSAREEGCCSQSWSDASWWTKRRTCGVLGHCG